MTGTPTVIAHDYLNDAGGAERVVSVFANMFPDAPVLTSVFDEERMKGLISPSRVRTSFLQAVARRKSITKALFPLLPFAFRTFETQRFDLVLSSSSGFAHHTRVRSSALHVCYCYTPPRFLWQPEVYFWDNPAAYLLLGPMLAAMRSADRKAAQRVDRFIAISTAVAARIRGTYGREAVVVHPPVDGSRFRPTTERSGRFLVVSRLLPYKRIDLAIEAANQLRQPLDIIGEGPSRGALEHLAGPTVRFLGYLADEDVHHYMASCVALILPGAEDFGLTVVEVQASGRPPIAYAGGGALDTVIDGVTGFLFDRPTPVSLREQMMRALRQDIPARYLIQSAERFSLPVFTHKLLSLLELWMSQRRPTEATASQRTERPPAADRGLITRPSRDDAADSPN